VAIRATQVFRVIAVTRVSLARQDTRGFPAQVVIRASAGLLVTRVSVVILGSRE